MIRKQNGEYIGECDECGSEEYGGTQAADFFEFVKILKKEGWRVHKDDEDEWKHVCPECCIANGWK